MSWACWPGALALRAPRRTRSARCSAQRHSAVTDVSGARPPRRRCTSRWRARARCRSRSWPTSTRRAARTCCMACASWPSRSARRSRATWSRSAWTPRCPPRASGLACGGMTISCGSRRLPCQLRRGRAAAVARPKVCQASRAALAHALGYAAAAVCQAARRQSQAGSGSPCRRLALPALGHATWSDAAQGV